MQTGSVLREPDGCDAQPADCTPAGSGKQAHRAYALTPDIDAERGRESVLLFEAGAVVRVIHGLTMDEAIAEGEAWLGD